MTLTENIIVIICVSFVQLTLSIAFWTWKINRYNKKEIEILKEISRIALFKAMRKK
jgi:hypothetical protein